MAALQAVQSEVAESARSCQAEYRLRMDAEAWAQRLEAQLTQVAHLMPAVLSAGKPGRMLSGRQHHVDALARGLLRCQGPQESGT